MRRREFIAGIGAAAAWPLAVRAQQKEMPVIGFLSPLPSGEPPPFAAFRRGLAEEGYVEGKNLAIEKRFTNFRPELMNEAAGDLVRLAVSVIFAAYPESLVGARNATGSIPTVTVDLESDPLAMGYIKSLARPGGNLTGMFLDLPELSGKQVGLLKEMVPGLSRMQSLASPASTRRNSLRLRRRYRRSGSKPKLLKCRSRMIGDAPWRPPKQGRSKPVFLLSSPLVFISSKQIGELALANRLPLISLFGEFPKAEGFMAYGPNIHSMWQRAGVYVGKILRGAKPNDLPIQRPEKFDLVINLKTAEALGLSVPPTLLARADEVIE
jgi:putative tryptophan/tyrosine transport system substrate-binding protein